MTIDTDLLPYLNAYAAAWPVSGRAMPLAKWRAHYDVVAAAMRGPHPHVAGLTVIDRDVRVGDHDVRVRLYRPDVDEPLPVMVYFHGGGWVIGSIDSHDELTADIAQDARCIVVSVAYRLAPEHPFPAPFDDCRAITEWVFAQAEAWGGDATRVFVGGDSAGGNLAAAVALDLRGSACRLRGQVLLYPCIDTDFGTASYRTQSDAPVLSAEQMRWFWSQYLHQEGDHADPRAVPMRAADLAGLPPTFVTAAEHDPLSDDATAYAERLRAAGVAVEFEPGPGMIHGYARLRRISVVARRIHGAMCAWLLRAATPAA